MAARISTESDGLTLEKYYDESAFELPSIVYEVTNRTDEDVAVRLEETVPEPLEPSDLGFHEEFGRDNWDLDGRDLAFERRVEANAECKTVIGIRRATPPAAPEMVTKPGRFEGTAVESPATADSEDARVEAAIAGSTGGGVGAETLDRSTTIIEENGSDVAGSASTEAEDEDDVAGEDDSANRDGTADDSIVEELVRELQNDDVAESNLEYLEERFGSQRDAPTSVDARIKQLQQDLADLRAYKTSLEGFLDTHGSADEVIERFETRLDELDDRVASMEASLGAHQTDIDANRAAIADNDAALERVTAGLERTEEELDTVAEDVGSVQADLERNEEELDAVAEDVAAVQADLPEFDLEERIRDHDEQLGEIRSLQQKLERVFAGTGDDE